MGPGGSKSGLAEVAGAELSGWMRDQKIARGCGAKQISKSSKASQLQSAFGSEVVENAYGAVGRSGLRSQSGTKTQSPGMSRPILDPQPSFFVAGVMDCAPSQKASQP